MLPILTVLLNFSPQINNLFVMLVLYLFSFYKTGSYDVVLADLELTM